MSVKLHEALDLFESKKLKVKELIAERQRAAVIKFDEGDSEDIITRPERTVDELSQEIDFINNQLITLQHLITTANKETVTSVVINEKPLDLGEVLLKLRQMRDELPSLNVLQNLKNSKSKVKEREMVKGEVVNVPKIQVTEVLFNISDMRKKVELYEDTIKQLQSVVTELNSSVTIEFDNVKFGA